MKKFNGKAIYNPSGKAGEYSYWACNFYTGCSNDCDYCYCKRGVMSHTWSNKPLLKKCFKSAKHALEIFDKELLLNLEELQKHGLFFSFTTDPMLVETIELTFMAIVYCWNNHVPVYILTKNTDWIFPNYLPPIETLIAGFTLTGHDELEGLSCSNSRRIDSMAYLKGKGYRTFASIEPIIDFQSSLKMIKDARYYCDLFKIGLQSGRKYDQVELLLFINDVHKYIPQTPIYWKDDLLVQAGITRAELPSNCVEMDFKLHLKQ